MTSPQTSDAHPEDTAPSAEPTAGEPPAKTKVEAIPDAVLKQIVQHLSSDGPPEGKDHDAD